MSLALRGRLLASRGIRLLQTRSYADEMRLTLAAGNKTFYENANVRQIDVPTFSGDFGILPKHVPTLGIQFCGFNINKNHSNKCIFQLF